MSEGPKISVIMPVYNAARYLREAIDSILCQTFPHFELIIINDGSTDDSERIVADYDDDRIRVINNEVNIGQTRSRNKAIEEARGEYIALQDADDVSLPKRFKQQLVYFEEHPEVALLGTGFYNINDTGKVLWRKIHPQNLSKALLLQRNRTCTGSIMFKKEVIDKVGPFDEFFRYCEDYELWLRVAEHYQISNLNQPLYKYRTHNECISVKQEREMALYGILAQRLARGELSEEIMILIKGKGIEELCRYLTKEEMIIVHKASGHSYLMANNLRSARKEWVRILRLDPLNMNIHASLLISLLGSSATIKVYKAYSRMSKKLL